MIEMSLAGVRIELPTNQPIVLLREADGERFLPIWIGQAEAAAIALSEDPEVKCVEENAISELSGGPAIQTDQFRTIPIGSMTNAFCTHNPTRPDQKGSKLYFDPRRPR